MTNYGKIDITLLKKALKNKTKSELVNEICFLAENYPEVDRHYYMLNSSFNVQYSQCSQLCEFIKNEFDPPVGFPSARIDQIKKKIHDFKLTCQFPYLKAHCYIFYSLECLKYLINYKDLIYDMIDNEIVNAFRGFAKIHFENHYDLLDESHLALAKEALRLADEHGFEIYSSLLKIVGSYQFPIKWK